MKKTLLIVGYILSIMLAIVLAGVLGIVKTFQFAMAPAPAALAATTVPLPPPPYDPNKPTVAIVLGNSLTEATDFFGPYAMFAAAGAYNVYGVAETRELRTLTGGIDVVPQLSFAELASQLHGAPDIIVVPAMADINAATNAPVLQWLRANGQGQTILFSWCSGAEVLAASGLVDGKSVTTHWGNIDGYERAYPAVNWVRGMRYIDLLDSDRLLTTGGLTSGIDATLHLLTRLNGAAVAAQVAQTLQIPFSPYVENPQMAQYTFDVPDSIVVLNFAFNWPKRQSGLWLYDGVGEFDLAALVDVHAAMATYQTYSVADTSTVVTRYGLQLVPRVQLPNVPQLDRMLVPGGVEAEAVAQRLTDELGETGVPVTLIQDDQAATFAYTSALEDFAREQDQFSLLFAVKRLEIRTPVDVAAAKWPWHLLTMPLLAGLAGAFAFAGIVRLSRRRFGFNLKNKQVQGTIPPTLARREMSSL